MVVLKEECRLWDFSFFASRSDDEITTKKKKSIEALANERLIVGRK